MIPQVRLAMVFFAAVSSLAPRATGSAGFRYWDVADPALAPATLSATGLYGDIAAKDKRMLPAAFHFEVNSALWSDDAKKKRWVLLKTGTSIGFRVTDDYWDYPDGAVFIKQFAIDTVTGDSSSRVLWETRLLINAKEEDDPATGALTDHWYGFSYKWDADQKEARLVMEESPGRKDSIRVWPQGLGHPSRMKKWVFPSADQCDRCHISRVSDTLHARSVLGFFTAQLNRPHPDAAGINQLEYFFDKRILTGTRATWDAATTPRWYGVDDSANPKATLDIRARSYIAANCSGCHGARGEAVGAADRCHLNYDFHKMTAQMEFRKHPTGWFGLDDESITPTYFPKADLANNPMGMDSLLIEPALVVPGYPQKSVLLFRQRSRDTVPGSFDGGPAQMPPVASFEVNIKATALIEKWIREMPALPATIVKDVARGGKGLDGYPRFLPGRIEIPSDVLRSHAKVSLASITGTRVEIRSVAAGIFAIPPSLPRGLYLLRVGSQGWLHTLP
jgi:hypothetical protein